MRKKHWSLLILMVSASFYGYSKAGAANDDSLGALSVQQLITQLGDEQYVLRQRAEMHLLERGAEVFAALQAAESSADLEISKRARYILNQISIDWVRSTDSRTVRSIMASYGELSQQSKLGKVGKLSRLENEQGFGALCRIARYESIDLVARFAALAILEKGFLPTARTAAAVTALTEEMGEGTEVPASWISVYVDQLQSPEQIDPRWLTLIDAEIELLTDEASRSNKSLASTFLHSYLDLCDQLSDAKAILAGLERRMELGAKSNEAMNVRLLGALNWITDREQWEALGLFEDHYADAIKSQRLLLYFVAVAREKQGRLADAEEIAQQAFQLIESSDPFAETDAQERNRCGLLISEFGRHDWAEREWRSVIDTEENTDFESLKSRQSLGNFCLHDRLEHKAAADLLAETIDAIYGDPDIKKLYRSDPTLWYRLTILRSHREYFLAFHFQTLDDTEKQRQHLEQAYKIDPSNADVLIAMYRLKDANAAYRKQTQQRIAKSLRSVEAAMKKSKQDSQWYNHWAWLVSNTEGDFAKAVQYSLRSLELEPGSPSYLDTLGRCYYAVGDLENAVKVEREAVAKYPHLMVMQRQLQFFEKELQDSKEGEAGR